ncbi:MAG TPA: hypothetical protein PKN88_09425 [Bacillota bacterium]|nr:hypothetical protein [Bacillota bacterium]
MKFYVGLHQVSQAKYFDCCFISVNRLKNRKSDFAVNTWIMDSGAFSQIYHFGDYSEPEEAYAEQINRWKRCGNLLAAVSQDYMCEPFILVRTGRTVEEHQAFTIQRYKRLTQLVKSVYIMPVLQGYEPEEYTRHIDMYGDLLKPGMWVGVGSVCKRNTNPAGIIEVLYAIKKARPDLRLHGFGLKVTALMNGTIRGLLHSADSMAWSFAARREGRNANDWKEAMRYKEKIENMGQGNWQLSIYDLKYDLKMAGGKIKKQPLPGQW